MDDLTKLVSNALERTVGEHEGTAVLTVGPGRYVQWVGFRNAIDLEVGNPARYIGRSRWQRLRGRDEAPAAPPMTADQIAALTRLGYATGTGNYELVLGPADFDREQAAAVIVSTLREVLGVRGASAISVEIF